MLFLCLNSALVNGSIDSNCVPIIFLDSQVSLAIKTKKIEEESFLKFVLGQLENGYFVIFTKIGQIYSRVTQ